MSDKIIGIDIGGTKIHLGVVQDSKIIKELIFPTSAKAPKEQIITEIIQGIKKVSDSNFQRIGIEALGLFDDNKQIIHDLWKNILFWKEFVYKYHLEIILGTLFFIQN